jgi:hypothetical protein
MLHRNESMGERYLQKEHPQSPTYHGFYSVQKKYFLICGGCCWMASTLQQPPDNLSNSYKKCPTCENVLDRISIPKQHP